MRSINAQKRFVSIINLQTFSNINLVIFSDRERSPYKNNFKEGCLYGEIAFINSLR